MKSNNKVTNVECNYYYLLSVLFDTRKGNETTWALFWSSQSKLCPQMTSLMFSFAIKKQYLMFCSFIFRRCTSLPPWFCSGFDDWPLTLQAVLQLDGTKFYTWGPEPGIISKMFLAEECCCSTLNQWCFNSKKKKKNRYKGTFQSLRILT